MSIFKLAAAAAIVISGFSLPAAAQPPGHDPMERHDNMRDRDQSGHHGRDARDDNGRHEGWESGRHHGWRHHRGHRVCRWIWRYHHRVRRCWWVR